jgi:hypothetical protein
VASTIEAEYMGAAAAVKKALWFRKLAGDIGLEIGGVQILCDNQGPIKLLKHPIASQRSKHIDVLHHFAREGSKEGGRVRSLPNGRDGGRFSYQGSAGREVQKVL